MECTENRALDMSNIDDKTADEAWKALIAADDERDLEDVREVGKH